MKLEAIFNNTKQKSKKKKMILFCFSEEESPKEKTMRWIRLLMKYENENKVC